MKKNKFQRSNQIQIPHHQSISKPEKATLHRKKQAKQESLSKNHDCN
jgi:hypothetical protein